MRGLQLPEHNERLRIKQVEPLEAESGAGPRPTSTAEVALRPL
jgi:hypothetical protein